MKPLSFAFAVLLSASLWCAAADADAQKEAFQKRYDALNKALQEQVQKDQAAAYREFDSGVRKLLADYPNLPEAYDVMSFLAGFSESDEAKAMAQKVIDSQVATTDAKQKARATITKLDRLGKPLTLKFTALDGREIDLEKLKGKVVLIDFWATWCPPCVAEMPHLKSVYEKYRERGLEIVGLSLDRDRKALEKFVAREKIPWPQRFDGEPWEKSMAQKYGLTGIPTQWLLDKQGILRHVTIQDHLEEKIEKLL